MLAEKKIKSVSTKEVELTSKGKVTYLQTKVSRVFDSFLSMHSKNSMDTVSSYEQRVNEFFEMLLGKKTAFVTTEEVLAIEKSDIQIDYIDKLSSRGNSNSTIRTKLDSVSSFYKELMANNIMVNPMILKVKLPVTINHHDALDSNELIQLYEFMRNEKQKGKVKYLFCKTLFIIGGRRGATSRMTWSKNFVVRKDSKTGQDVHVIRIEDNKGNKVKESPVSDEFYNELQELNQGQEKVFDISLKTMERAMKRFSEFIGRKITLHSLKATAITIGYELTKDMELCRQLGGHASSMTTEIYLREEDSLVNQLSYNMGRELSPDKLYSLSHSELLALIDSNEDIKNRLIMRLEE